MTACLTSYTTSSWRPASFAVFRLWRNTDGTASCSARSTVTLPSAPFPELPVAGATKALLGATMTSHTKPEY